jgi:hypothetical protein
MALPATIPWIHAEPGYEPVRQSQVFHGPSLNPEEVLHKHFKGWEKANGALLTWCLGANWAKNAQTTQQSIKKLVETVKVSFATNQAIAAPSSSAFEVTEELSKRLLVCSSLFMHRGAMQELFKGDIRSVLLFLVTDARFGFNALYEVVNNPTPTSSGAKRLLQSKKIAFTTLSVDWALATAHFKLVASAIHRLANLAQLEEHRLALYQLDFINYAFKLVQAILTELDANEAQKTDAEPTENQVAHSKALRGYLVAIYTLIMSLCDPGQVSRAEVTEVIKASKEKTIGENVKNLGPVLVGLISLLSMDEDAALYACGPIGMISVILEPIDKVIWRGFLHSIVRTPKALQNLSSALSRIAPTKTLLEHPLTHNIFVFLEILFAARIGYEQTVEFGIFDQLHRIVHLPTATQAIRIHTLAIYFEYAHAYPGNAFDRFWKTKPLELADKALSATGDAHLRDLERCHGVRLMYFLVEADSEKFAYLISQHPTLGKKAIVLLRSLFPASAKPGSLQLQPQQRMLVYYLIQLASHLCASRQHGLELLKLGLLDTILSVAPQLPEQFLPAILQSLTMLFCCPAINPEVTTQARASEATWQKLNNLAAAAIALRSDPSTPSSNAVHMFVAIIDAIGHDERFKGPTVSHFREVAQMLRTQQQQQHVHGPNCNHGHDGHGHNHGHSHGGHGHGGGHVHGPNCNHDHGHSHGDHDHDHDHDHDCDHDHDHGHGHDHGHSHGAQKHVHGPNCNHDHDHSHGGHSHSHDHGNSHGHSHGGGHVHGPNCNHGPDSSVPRTPKIIGVTACAVCKKSNLPLQKCSRCKAVSYCSITCQKAAWPTHKATCKAPTAK